MTEAERNKRAILNGDQKRAVFESLMRYGGVGEEEILTAIQYCPPQQLTENDVLMKILTRRDQMVPITSQQQQENDDIDRAIRESEDEREIIQERKRKRVEELKNVVTRVAEADEFRKSVLLYGIPPTQAQTGESMDGTSSSRTSTGSVVLQELMMIVDSMVITEANGAPSSSSSSLCNGISYMHSKYVSAPALQQKALMIGLRTSLINLLLIECTAVKFYKKEPKLYLEKVARRVDETLNCAPKTGNDEPAMAISDSNSGSGSGGDSSSSGGGGGNTAVYSNPLGRVSFDIEDCVAVLDRERAKLERGLFKLPKDGHPVPLIFRRASLQTMVSATGLQIDGGSSGSSSSSGSDSGSDSGSGSGGVVAANGDPNDTIALGRVSLGSGSCDVDGFEVQEMVSAVEVARILAMPSDDEDSEQSEYVSSDDEVG